MSLHVVPPPVLSEEDPFAVPDGLERVARPAEAREPWELLPSSALRAVASDAHVLRLPLAVAVSLVCELRLVYDDLRERSTVELDTCAHDVRVGARLSFADAAYLRLLMHGCRHTRRVDCREAVVVDLPARLSSRIVRCGGPQRLLAGGLLSQALSWERAAVLEGRTMSEWAPLAVLRARQR